MIRAHRTKEEPGEKADRYRNRSVIEILEGLAKEHPSSSEAIIRTLRQVALSQEARRWVSLIFAFVLALILRNFPPFR